MVITTSNSTNVKAVRQRRGWLFIKRRFGTAAAQRGLRPPRSEFGGIHWNPEARPLTREVSGVDVLKHQVSWGYGKSPRTLEEFYARFAGLCQVLLDDPLMFGYCYTQLTDVYQEQNGLFFFNRSAKFDLARLRAVQARVAAIGETATTAQPVELTAPVLPTPEAGDRTGAPGAGESFSSLTQEDVAANEEDPRRHPGAT